MTSYIDEIMDYSQSNLQLHDVEDWSFAISGNDTLPGAYRNKSALGVSHSTAQDALLLIPSAVLLLLFPIRVFQLRRASLKVLPNYTGAIKAVCCSRSQGSCTDSIAGGHCVHCSTRISFSARMLDI